ncbi:MAG: hypothetical protein QOG49_293, partial [Frankiaceae bacterium]|nr:hypothetical protein [Frankiaceae bacterium]
MTEPLHQLDSTIPIQPNPQRSEPADRDVTATTEHDDDMPLAAEFAAKHAIVDAGNAALAAATSSATSVAAATAANLVARRARAATAAAVAAAAVLVAEAAAAAATAVEDDAIARAVDAAAAAVAALEMVAAERPVDGDNAEADRVAAAVAVTVAADVVASEELTAAAADTVAAAVSAAAEAAAAVARQAAVAVERQASAAARASGVVVDASAVTVAATEVVVESTQRVADLAARLRVVAALRDSEHRFRVTFDNAAAGMMLVSLSDDDNGRLLRVNPALRAITGRPDAELLDLTVTDLFSDDDRAEQSALFADLAGGTTSAYEAHSRWRHASGRQLWVHASVHAIREESGLPAYAVCHVEDISERRHAEEALRRREERFRLAFDNALTGMAFLSVDGTVRRVNNALTALLGRSERELLGQRLETLASEHDQPSILAGISGVLAGEFTTYQAEHQFVHADGHPVWSHLSGSVEQDADGPDYLVFQVTDISQRKEAENLLAHQALHDELTGLPNRALLAEHLDGACQRAARSGAHVAVLFLDLDDFKEINDSLGHVVGDEVLVEVAARLRGCLRGLDLAARIGGDEFVVVCEGLDDPARASDVADRIDRALSAPLLAGETEVHLSVSVGISTAPAAASAADLLHGADTAMYQAKSNGKDRYEVYDEAMSVRARRHVRVAGELLRALTEDELRLHYQPTYGLRTGRITGVEALLRWEHPTRGLLAPSEFLDVAESRRLLIPIGDWVVAKAMAQAGQWYAAFGPRAPDVWVNIAGQQLGAGHLTAVVEQLLERTELPAAKFGVEITERQLVGRQETVTADLAALRSLGLRLAIDDFGTG